MVLTKKYQSFVWGVMACLSMCQFCVASKSAEEETVDGRPAYMKLEKVQGKDSQGNTISYWKNDLGAAYGLISQENGEELRYAYYEWPTKVLSVGIDPYDFKSQHEELKHVFKNGSGLTQIVDVSCFSKETKTNPVVVLWLHGSDGPSIPFLLIQKLFEKGLGYVSFPRFLSDREEREDGYTKRFHTTWERQDTLSLFSEIAMVYGVCQKLVERGTEKIILMGHSRGGILALTCAMEEYAQHFRKINVGDRVGSVIGYVPISGLPLIHLPGGLTQEEPIGVFHGVNDGVCSYEMMKLYMDEQQEKKNVSFFEEDFGHLPWERVKGGFRGSLGLWLHDLWRYKFSPKKWFTHTAGNAWVNMKAPFQRNPGYIRNTKENVQNFNGACVRIGEGWETFTSLQKPDQKMEIAQLPQFVKNHVTRGFELKEKISRPEQEEALIEKIVDFMVSIQKK